MGNGNSRALRVSETTLDKLCQLIRDDPYRGHVVAARQLGIQGSAGEIRAMLAGNERFQETLLEARATMFDASGLSVKTLLKTLGKIAATEGPSQHRAVIDGLGLQGLHPRQQIEVTGRDGGPLEVNNPDVAAAIERFTSTVVRLAARGPAELPPGPTSG